MFCIQTCCNKILSAAEGFRGQEATCADPGIFISFLVLSLFYSLQRGFNGFIAEKTILILYRGSTGGSLFSRGGGSNFFQGGGVQMLISIETHITCYFPGGVRAHYPPLDPYMGNVVITGQYLSQSRF